MHPLNSPVRDYRTSQIDRLKTPERAALTLQTALECAEEDGCTDSFRYMLSDLFEALGADATSALLKSVTAGKPQHRSLLLSYCSDFAGSGIETPESIRLLRSLVAARRTAIANALFRASEGQTLTQAYRTLNCHIASAALVPREDFRVSALTGGECTAVLARLDEIEAKLP